MVLQYGLPCLTTFVLLLQSLPSENGSNCLLSLYSLILSLVSSLVSTSAMSIIMQDWLCLKRVVRVKGLLHLVVWRSHRHHATIIFIPKIPKLYKSSDGMNEMESELCSKSLHTYSLYICCLLLCLSHHFSMFVIPLCCCWHWCMLSSYGLLQFLHLTQLY